MNLIDGLNAQQVKDMTMYVADQIIDNVTLLTEVDSKIGDGDHGVGMQIGFTKAKETLEKIEPKTINEVFSLTGMSMIKSMGGASGVIFGTMYMGAVKGIAPIEILNPEMLATIFEHSLHAVKERGKAQLGDKTMIDAFEPAVLALKDSSQKGKDLLSCMIDAETAALAGLENTKGFAAKIGRAKSMGDRSIGYQDAGATSIWIIFQSMREWLERAEG